MPADKSRNPIILDDRRGQLGIRVGYIVSRTAGFYTVRRAKSRAWGVRVGKGRVRGSEEGGGLMFGPEDRHEAGAPVTAPSISVPLPVR